MPLGTPITIAVKATEYKKTDWKRFRATLNFEKSKSPLVLAWRHVWPAVNTLNLGFRGLGFKPRCRIVSLDKDLYSTSSLFTQVYKMGTSDILLGDNPAMD